MNLALWIVGEFVSTKPFSCAMITVTKMIKMLTVALKFRFKKNQKVKTLMSAGALIHRQYVGFYRTREVSLTSAGGEA